MEPVDQLGEFLGGGPEAERLARPAVELAGDLVEFCLCHAGETLALREVLAQQAVGVLVGPALPRARGSQKYTSTPVSTLNRRCSAISLPWSEVSERRSWAGSVVMLASGASQTGSALVASGSATSWQ